MVRKPFYWRTERFNLNDYLHHNQRSNHATIPTQQRTQAWQLIQKAAFVASSDQSRTFMQQILQQSRKGIKPTIPQMREVQRIIRYGDGFKLALWDSNKAQRPAMANHANIRPQPNRHGT